MFSSVTFIVWGNNILYWPCEFSITQTPLVPKLSNKSMRRGNIWDSKHYNYKYSSPVGSDDVNASSLQPHQRTESSMTLKIQSTDFPSQSIRNYNTCRAGKMSNFVSFLVKTGFMCCCFGEPYPRGLRLGRAHSCKNRVFLIVFLIIKDPRQHVWLAYGSWQRYQHTHSLHEILGTWTAFMSQQACEFGSILVVSKSLLDTTWVICLLC